MVPHLYLVINSDMDRIQGEIGLDLSQLHRFFSTLNKQVPPAQLESPYIYVGGLRWRIVAMHPNGPNPRNKYPIYLECEGEPDNDKWNCVAAVRFTRPIIYWQRQNFRGRTRVFSDGIYDPVDQLFYKLRKRSTYSKNWGSVRND